MKHNRITEEKIMKIGTWVCCLFGHKFSWKKPLIINNYHALSWREPIKTDYCVRCGIIL